MLPLAQNAIFADGGFAAYAVHGLLGIGSLVCFVLVVIQMFNRGQTVLAIASIVLIFCCGIGGLIVFIVGWINATKWNIKNIMIVWTILVVIGIAMNFVMPIGMPQQFLNMQR
jgi:hypothetical protein